METASNIIISILSSIIGGLFTFGGVWLTIKHEQKKERRNYLESIKPYLVVQHLVDSPRSRHIHALRKIERGSNGSVRWTPSQ